MKMKDMDSNTDRHITSLIKDASNTPSSDLLQIANSEPYKKVLNMGKRVIPYLLKDKLIIWDHALSELTGQGLCPHEYTTSERVDYWKKWGRENGHL
jgi:hypothetical protein